MAEQLTNRFDFESLFTTPLGQEPPSDSPLDDRTDAALEARFRSYRQADDLNWLLEGIGKPQEALEAPAGTKTAASDDWSLKGLAGATATDLGMGAVEGPRQAVGGMRDAAQSILDFTDTVGDWAESKFALGGMQIMDAEGNFDPRYLDPEEWADAQRAGMTDPQLPKVGEGSTVTSSAIRSIAQFLTGFGMAGRAMGGFHVRR